MKVSLLLLLVAASITDCLGGPLPLFWGQNGGAKADESSTPSIKGFIECISKGLTNNIPATLKYLNNFFCNYNTVKINGTYENPAFQNATTELVNFLDKVDCSIHELTGIKKDAEHLVEAIAIFGKTTADDLVKAISQHPDIKILNEATCALGPVLAVVGSLAGSLGTIVGELSPVAGAAEPLA